MKKYKFKKYSKKYPNLFEKEKEKLAKILPDAEIEHTGSTSVPKLGGKGILDIIIGTKELANSKNKLIKAKYHFKKSGGTKDRLFFKKDYRTLFSKRRVHLQLTKIKSKIWKAHSKFRKKLLENKGIREQYAQVKREGVKKAKGDGKVYRKHKDNFIQKHSK